MMPSVDNVPLLAYFGLGGGAELVPYFFALLSLAGAALVAVVQWPFTALVRRLRRFKPEGEHVCENQTDIEETPLDGSRVER